MIHVSIALVLLAGGTPRSVAPISLEDLACISDTVVVGRVVDVSCYAEPAGSGPVLPMFGDGGYPECREGTAVATVRVERVLSGDPAARSLAYMAESTWLCDMTTAVVGERALFFLDQQKLHGWEGLELPALDELRIDGRPVLGLAHAGCGRMPISEVDGAEWIEARDTVEPPDGLAGLADESIYWRAPLESVVAAVGEARAARPTPMPIHPETKLPASVAVLEDGRVLAAVWDDGTAYRWEPESASFFRGEVDPEIWSLWRDSELHDAVDSWSEGAPPANQVRVSIRTRLFRAVHSIDSLETVIRLPSDGLAARLLAEIQRRLPESGTDTGLTSLEIR